MVSTTNDLVESPASRTAAAAERLSVAAATLVPCAPVRDLIGSDDARAAYAVQALLTAARVSDGAKVTGRKVGLTSAAVQAQLGVDQPDFGVLFDDMAIAEGQPIAMDRLLQPKVEAEVAFVLDADLVDGPLDVAQVRGAVAHMVPALEICDSRVADWDITFGDTVADNASAGCFVLGPGRVLLTETEPKAVEMTMTVNGHEVAAGSGSACLGDPLAALAWLAQQAREFDDPLRAGQVVLSGALGPMHLVCPGDTVTASISGLGSVTTSFSEGTN